MEENKQQNSSPLLLEDEEKKKTTYKVDGEEVVLSRTIVRKYLARGDDAVTDADIVQFISLCRVNQLNPFVGDAYLVRYKGKDGRPANTQMIISKEAFMKRAESDPRYKGYQAGVIILHGSDIVEQEGSFFMRGDTLLGGWAKVYIEGRNFPVVSRVRIEEYNKGKSTWTVLPGTMIRKVAMAQAFREAFPLRVGGMYLPEEMPDEQGGTAPAAIENSEKPQFVPEKTIDPPAPEFTADPNPADFTPDPEPAPETAQGQEDGPDPALVKAGLIDPEENAEESLFRL